MRLQFFIVTIVAILAIMALVADGKSSTNSSQSNQTKGRNGTSIKTNTTKTIKTKKTKIPKAWNKNRLKALNERRAGGAKLGLFKKGAAFEMDRKEKAIRFQILNILETKMDDSTVKHKVDAIDFNIVKSSNNSNYGVPADVTVVEGKLENNATVDFTMVVFRENGTITTDDGYEFDVLEGALKFNLELDWPYETKYLDPTIGLKCFHGKKGQKGKKSEKLKGKKGASIKGKRSPESFGFCESVRVTFSSTYKSDSTWLDMPEDYPITKISEGSGWSKVTLRFKGQKIVYDPITELGEDIIVAVESVGDSNVGIYIKGSAFTLIGAFLMVLMTFM